MSDFIGTCLQKFVAASVAVAMTGLLALSVIDSTTSGSVDQVRAFAVPDLSCSKDLRSAIPPGVALRFETRPWRWNSRTPMRPFSNRSAMCNNTRLMPSKDCDFELDS